MPEWGKFTEGDGTLIHYGSRPLTVVRSMPLADQEDDHKPKGLWVSVAGDDDWKSWCLAEEFAIENLQYPHRIVLSEAATILRLTTADGIIIAPYIWERRLHMGTEWYYSWDCASGCIWNASAIEQIVPMEQEEIALQDVNR